MDEGGYGHAYSIRKLAAPPSVTVSAVCGKSMSVNSMILLTVPYLDCLVSSVSLFLENPGGGEDHLTGGHAG